MNLTLALFRLLLFPGLLYAVPVAWFLLWTERKTVALMQRRIGPPFLQPFYDFMKLMGKSVPRATGNYRRTASSMADSGGSGVDWRVEFASGVSCAQRISG